MLRTLFFLFLASACLTCRWVVCASCIHPCLWTAYAWGSQSQPLPSPVSNILCCTLCPLCDDSFAAALQESHAEQLMHRRMLAQPAVQKPQSSSQTSNGSQTCCQCKCVIPAKDMRSPECRAKPGCVGMGAPQYGQKNICQPGANRSCDDVCKRDMGSWKAYYEC